MDKTEQIYHLISTQSAQYFLFRRFGKSLLVSTIKAIFEGKRELFEALAIDGLSSGLEHDGRELILVGVEFAPNTRNLGRWVVER